VLLPSVFCWYLKACDWALIQVVGKQYLSIVFSVCYVDDLFFLRYSKRSLSGIFLSF
jgi:hypothetical protein